MKNKDLLKAEIRNRMNEAVKNNDSEAFMGAFMELVEDVEDGVVQRANEIVANALETQDKGVMTARGVRQLTSEESGYYNKVIEAMKSQQPKMALTHVDVTMPLTIIDSVMQELKEKFPLLEKINFTNTTGLTKFILQDRQRAGAKWGQLSGRIVEEIVADFKTIDLKLLKLTAFLPVSKDMLDLGAVWLDEYVRGVLVNVLLAGLEEGIINGDGKDKPIGMIRQVGAGVNVVGGVYPEKAKTKITEFSIKEVGKLTAQLAVGADGRAREVKDLILVVNPEDYHSKILPATRVLTATGIYANVFPNDTQIIVSSAIAKGTAVYGIASNYFMGLGSAVNGKIEYSDDAKFLEDERIYMIKLYGNGEPKDNTSFIHLNIADVKEFNYTVKTVAGA